MEATTLPRDVFDKERLIASIKQVFRSLSMKGQVYLSNLPLDYCAKVYMAVDHKVRADAIATFTDLGFHIRIPESRSRHNRRDTSEVPTVISFLPRNPDFQKVNDFLERPLPKLAVVKRGVSEQQRSAVLLSDGRPVSGYSTLLFALKNVLRRLRLRSANTRGLQGRGTLPPSCIYQRKIYVSEINEVTEACSAHGYRVEIVELSAHQGDEVLAQFYASPNNNLITDTSEKMKMVSGGANVFVTKIIQGFSKRGIGVFNLSGEIQSRVRITPKAALISLCSLSDEELEQLLLEIIR